MPNYVGGGDRPAENPDVRGDLLAFSVARQAALGQEEIFRAVKALRDENDKLVERCKALGVDPWHAAKRPFVLLCTLLVVRPLLLFLRLYVLTRESFGRGKEWGRRGGRGGSGGWGSGGARERDRA